MTRKGINLFQPTVVVNYAYVLLSHSKHFRCENLKYFNTNLSKRECLINLIKWSIMINIFDKVSKYSQSRVYGLRDGINFPG